MLDKNAAAALDSLNTTLIEIVERLPDCSEPAARAKSPEGTALMKGGGLLETATMFFALDPDAPIDLVQAMRNSILPFIDSAADALDLIGLRSPVDGIGSVLDYATKKRFKLIRPKLTPVCVVDGEREAAILLMQANAASLKGLDAVSDPDLQMLAQFAGSWCAVVFHTNPVRVKKVPREFRRQEATAVDGHTRRYAEGLIPVPRRDLSSIPEPVVVGLEAAIALGTYVTARRTQALRALGASG